MPNDTEKKVTIMQCRLVTGDNVITKVLNPPEASDLMSPLIHTYQFEDPFAFVVMRVPPEIHIVHCAIALKDKSLDGRDAQDRMKKVEDDIAELVGRKPDEAYFEAVAEETSRHMGFGARSKRGAIQMEAKIRKYIEEHQDISLVSLQSSPINSYLRSSVEPHLLNPHLLNTSPEANDEQVEYKVVMEPLSPLGMPGTRVLVQSSQVAYWIADMNKNILNQYIRILSSFVQKRDEKQEMQASI